MDGLTAERWRRIRSILDRALEAPPLERRVLLEEACGDDAELRREVESLIEAEARAGRLLHDPLAEYADALVVEMAQASSGAETMVGRQVGAYRLVREVARGGMGTVYLAERADGQFAQRVAVKLLRRGLDTDDLLHRFVSERQILASLNHPNIAHLLDGGATEDGRPYLVMEYVEGQPIDAYCDARRLTIEQRLDHFVTVAHAVQHAHRNLVIHRDLKPGNILVGEDGEVKLLDFGIAKLLSADTTAAAPVTRTGVRLLTPEYASPEQVQGAPITTASDVYQLGLLLYELLTGRRAHQLAGRTPVEAEREVCDREPPPPSAVVNRERVGRPRYAGSTGEAPALAWARRSTPERLRKRLRGDLDAITLQALRKEPERRYPSVDALIEDVQRLRAGLPVRARSETRAYRARKFLRRHRWGVGAAAVLIVLLAGYAVTVSVQAGRIQAALGMARLETEKAEQVTDLLLELFAASRPEQARGEEVTARDLLARGVERAEQLEEQPEVQARMFAVIGKTYHRFGLYAEAQRLYERALALRQRLFGSPHEQVAESLSDLGVLLKDRGELTAAEPLLREALAMRRQLLGAEHADLAISLDELGRLLQELGDYAGAEPLFREGLAMRRRVHGNVHHETASSLNSVGLVLRNQGRADEAEPVIREALAVYRQLFGDDHPWTATVKSNLASILIERSQWPAAQALLQEALEVDLRALGEEHPSVPVRLHHLGTVYREQGRLMAADSVLSRAVQIARTTLGDAHPQLAQHLLNHARVQLERGEPIAAEALLREALEIRRSAFAADDWRTAEAAGWLGTALASLGRQEEAESLVVASHAVLERRWGADDSRTREAFERMNAFYQSRDAPP